MKLGMNMLLWSTFVTDEHLPVLEQLKQIGFDGVEIPLFTGAVEHYAKLGKQLDEIGLERTTCMALTEPDKNPVSDEPAQRAAAKDQMQWLIDCAHAVGAPICIGPMYQPLGQFTGQGPSETELQRATDLLRELAPTAQQAGVTLVIEAINRFEAYMCNTLAQAAAMARRVDHPAVGMMVDTFHCHIEENDTLEAIRQAGDAIVHVHFSENTRGTPGDGQVDFAAVVNVLREIGYDGWIVNEVFGRALPDLAAATCIWRDLFASQMQCATDTHRFVRGLMST